MDGEFHVPVLRCPRTLGLGAALRSGLAQRRAAALQNGMTRLDVWLWAARFYKTRSLAARAIDLGRVLVDGARAKRSRVVHPGDQVVVRHPPFDRVV
ncbi:MAG: S4 domain-containing protein, partial [Gemmatimonadaceae bacterium]